MVLAAETTKRIESIDRHYWANPSQTLVENIGKFKKSVSLLTWGYNEEELIGPFLDRAIALLDANVEDWEIIFVNDGSRDRTGEILDEYAARDKRIVPIHNERNLNVGQSCKRAIKAANKDYLFWQTVDWSYDVKNLRVFLELLNYYDVVQGIRPTPMRLLSYVPILRSIYRVQKRSDNFQKAIVSLSNYYVLRILFGVKFQDFQNVTFYPSKLIQSVVLEGNSSFLNPECLLRVYEKGARFIEVPIPFIPRTAGVAKGTKLKSIFASLADIAVSWLKWGWSYNSRCSQFGEKRIHRIVEPFQLEEEVAALAVPLFKEYR
ncbi:MAG: glycosyltransferase family 2 protein [Candidatus Melainabacteria bacterium]|nr:glycosyltransferase family 2 protein [Candidatus Melainabacteria bacterium]